MTTVQPRILSIRESEEKYGVRAFTLRKLIKSGVLPTIPIPGNKVYLSEQILVNFLNGESVTGHN